MTARDSIEQDQQFGARLPSGRHGLPREWVSSNQRARLLTATTIALVEHGYSRLTVSGIARSAGVSRATFYELFDDKDECVLAAYRGAAADFEHTVKAACIPTEGWTQGVVAATEAALRFACERKHEARLVFAVELICEPALAPALIATQERLASLLSRGRHGVVGETPRLSEATIAGATWVAARRLRECQPAELLALREELIEILLTPYLGCEGARIAANSPIAGERSLSQLE